jgi:hypothetical protein
MHAASAAVLALILVTGCGASARQAAAPREAVDSSFAEPQQVVIDGYSADAMEPFVTRDGQWLLFNSVNLPGVNTEIHVARARDPLNFDYVGPLYGANSEVLDGVPTVDAQGTMYFVSVRSFPQWGLTIHRARFADGEARDARLVSGLPRGVDILLFDVEISADGETMYYSNGVYRGRSWPDYADLHIARRNGDGFRRVTESARIFAAINTDQGLEYAAAVSPDERELFFTRLVGKNPAIYRATRASRNDPFGAPARIAAIDGFAEAPTISPDGQALYYHKLDGRRHRIFRVAR